MPTLPGVGGTQQGGGASTAGGPDGGGARPAGATAAGPASAVGAGRPHAAARGGARSGTTSERAPATGAQRRLEQAVASFRGCLGDLAPVERRILTLRAGLGSGVALSRPQVARRLALGVARVGRLERAGLRRLAALDAAGACGVPASGAQGPFAALLGPAALSGAGGTGASAGQAAPSGARGAVEGAVASGGGEGGGAGGSGLDPLPPPLGHDSEATWPIALLLILTVALLVRWELRRR